METKIDRRIKYTKMVLKQSLLDLLLEKPINKVSVTEICRKADINRNTFYKHYANPEDLLAQIQDEYFLITQDILHQLKHSSTLEAMLTELCRNAAKNHELMQVILTDKGDRVFLERVLEYSYEEVLIAWKRLGLKASDEEFRDIFRFIAHGAIAIIENWLRNGTNEAPEKIAGTLNQLVYHGISAYIVQS